MKLKFKVLFFLLFSVLILNSQNSFPQNLLEIPILIKNENKTLGSGFILRFEDSVYVISARHVFVDEDFKNEKSLPAKNYPWKTDSATFIIENYPRNPLTEKSNSVYINLNHPRFENEVKVNFEEDIALIKIGIIDSTNVWINYLPHVYKKTNNPTMVNQITQGYFYSYEKVKNLIGNEVFTIGFPQDLNSANPKIDTYDFDRVLLRKGIISGIYEKKKRIISDAAVFGGNSGGPVFLKIEKLGQSIFYLIGIVIEFIPHDHNLTNYEDRKLIIRENSGYSVIEPVDKILDLLKGPKQAN